MHDHHLIFYSVFFQNATCSVPAGSESLYVEYGIIPPVHLY